MNNKDYKFYVMLSDGRIESGWEDIEDAKEQIENIPPKFQKGAKVLTLSGIKSKGINPDDDKTWAGNIMKESKFDNLYNSFSKITMLETTDPRKKEMVNNVLKAVINVYGDLTHKQADKILNALSIWQGDRFTDEVLDSYNKKGKK